MQRFHPTFAQEYKEKTARCCGRGKSTKILQLCIDCILCISKLLFRWEIVNKANIKTMVILYSQGLVMKTSLD